MIRISIAGWASGVVIAMVGWFALLLQLWLTLQPAFSGTMSFPAALESFFSYFTILTNLLVALALTLSLCFRRTPFGAWAAEPGVQTAVAVYIAVVGIIYTLVLRETWNPQGWQKTADVILHDLVPIAYVLYWILFVAKERLRWKDAFAWLSYPLFYLLYLLFRGAVVGRYPYPFVDLTTLSYATFCRNVALLFLLFLALSAVFIGFGRLGRRRSQIPTSIF